ncbi:hypothetical protein GEV33_000639 [Tenebrio molitor]|uniref:Uncharacterized protein n=1 Tax=Tenebrio molitor TaxID=7067 RepID=A0A8J6HX44_TENMO|nr:hypothetical protein GEV33_000639 [Tenebrio molitor]
MEIFVVAPFGTPPKHLFGAHSLHAGTRTLARKTSQHFLHNTGVSSRLHPKKGVQLRHSCATWRLLCTPDRIFARQIARNLIDSSDNCPIDLESVDGFLSGFYNTIELSI